MEYKFDPVAYAERQAEIAKLMARVKEKQLYLSGLIASGKVDMNDARFRNATMPGILGDHWASFIELPESAQIEALSLTEFKGMAWQSLLQCRPIFEIHKSS